MDGLTRIFIYIFLVPSRNGIWINWSKRRNFSYGDVAVAAQGIISIVKEKRFVYDLRNVEVKESLSIQRSLHPRMHDRADEIAFEW